MSDLRRWSVRVVALVGLIIAPGAAFAEHQREDRTIGEGFLYGGYIGGLSKKHFGGDTSAMGGLGVTMYLTPRLGVEGEMAFPTREFGPNRFSGSVQPILLLGQLIYLPWRDALEADHIIPYLSAGGGGNLTRGIGTGFTVGAGAKYSVGGVGLRLDGKVFFTEAQRLGTDALGVEPPVPAEKMTLFLLSLGVTLQHLY
jgi:hypothetical protein